MKSKTWFISFIITNIVLLSLVIGYVVYIDPFFHYHKPVSDFYYTLDNERSQNDGIIRNFDYDAIITGTSMTENFKTTEFDSLFGVKSIKIPFNGASYKEVNQNLEKALSSGREIKIVIRSLDMAYIYGKAAPWSLSGDQPYYLYDNNILNDAYYVLNKDVIYERCHNIFENYCEGNPGGITSFDSYASWNDESEYGKEQVLKKYDSFSKPTNINFLTEEDKKDIENNINNNIIDIALKYPNTEFYCFIPPYSIVWWGVLYEDGDLNKQIQAEKYAIELLLEVPNIKIYSWNNNYELITNLDNYQDYMHYGYWVNSMILEDICSEETRITKEKYKEYIKNELNYYSNYSYNELFN